MEQQHYDDKSLEELVEDNEKQKRLFVLGLIILFCWIIVIILCAYPQLFRDLFLRYVCCCFAGFAVRRREKCRQRAEKLAKARERLRSASKSFITVSTAVSPSAIMLKEIGLSELRQSSSSNNNNTITMMLGNRHERISMSEPLHGARQSDTEQQKCCLLDKREREREGNDATTAKDKSANIKY